MVAPMPRAAPVTNAILPSSGRSQSAGGAESSAPTRNTCPSTYADFPDSRNRSVDSIPVAAGFASAARYTRFTVAPRRISLPSERVNPSSARCAIRSPTLPVSSGTVPMTTIRPDAPRLRSSGVKNLYSPFSPAGSVMPVASYTRPPNESAQRPPRLLDTTS